MIVNVTKFVPFLICWAILCQYNTQKIFLKNFEYFGWKWPSKFLQIWGRVIFLTFWGEIFSVESIFTHVSWSFLVEHIQLSILKPKKSCKDVRFSWKFSLKFPFFEKNAFFKLSFCMMPKLLHGFFHLIVLTFMLSLA